MIDFPPIWYIYCFDKKIESNSYERLKISLGSIPSKFSINIITWHSNLNERLKYDFPRRNIFNLVVNKRKFSRSLYINLIADYEFKKNIKYFYLSDIDLFFHPEYFYWLKFIMEKLDYRSSDLRIITNNFNIRAIPKYKFLPDFLYGKLNFYFPELYNWNLPTNLKEILIRKLSKPGFAHGCGLIPLGALRKIGGYNSELIGHGPEDDLFNQRIKFYSRIYYHKGNYRSSTFHLPHPPINQQNRLNNFKYWFHSLEDININGVYSDLIRR